MGMDQRVTCRSDQLFDWPSFVDGLAAKGFAVDIRMIDGELSFPDETPPDSWRELRVGTPNGMVTLRRETDGIVVVTWGNADDAMRQSWNAIAWGVAQVTGGQVDGRSPDRYLEEADLPAGFRMD